MVAAISEEEAASSIPSSQGAKFNYAHHENPQIKSPLLLSREKDSKDGNVNNQRKFRSRQVSSRYMSPSPSTSTTSSSTTNTSSSSSSSNVSSRRFASPLTNRSTAASSIPFSSIKRSQSVDRKRPVMARSMTPVPGSRVSNAGEVSAASKLFTSTRSLSVSFQGEAFSLPISKEKTPTLSSVRKGTPERRRGVSLRGKVEGNVVDQVENSRPGDQHRWPARTREGNPLYKSLDCSVGERNVNGSDSTVKKLQEAMIDESRRDSVDSRLSLNLVKSQNPDTSSGNESSVLSDPTASDTDSASSGSNSGVHECGGGMDARDKSRPRGIVVSARFWQETNSRLRRLQDPSSPLTTSQGARMMGPTKFVHSKRISSDSPLSSPRTIPSPIRGATRPASPSRSFMPSVSSPSHGNPSPSQVRYGMVGNMSNDFSNGPSILSFSVDLRRGKIGENRIADAHLSRLLYNRLLQWRFINARADAAFLVQSWRAEKNLWNAWIRISELCRSVTVKRTKLQMLRQKLKLTSLLKGQMPYLEEWALLDREHSSSLLGTTEALKASTLRLPVAGKAVADIQSMKDAIGSAVDVVQAMGSSMYCLLSKVEEVNSLVDELVSVTAKEQALLNQCRDFLFILTAMQVKDSSMRTHILQLNHK